MSLPVLAVLGGALYLASRGESGTSTGPGAGGGGKTPPAPVAVPPRRSVATPPPKKGGANVAPIVAQLSQGMEPVAALAMEVGTAIAGDAGGTAGQIGGVVGRELDRALGGMPHSAVTTVAEVAGFLAAMSIVCIEFPIGTIIGAACLAAAGLIALGNDVWRLVDNNGIKERSAQALERYRKMRAAFTAAALQAIPNADERRVKGNARAFADGYAAQVEYLAWKSWDMRPRGLDNWEQHTEYGRVRGYWAPETAWRAELDGETDYEPVSADVYANQVAAGRRQANAEAWLTCTHEARDLFDKTDVDHDKRWNRIGGFDAELIDDVGVVIGGVRFLRPESKAAGHLVRQ